MPKKRVVQYEKRISINKNQRKFGVIRIKLEKVSRSKSFTFDDQNPSAFSQFLAFAHMLEHDIVYYDSDTKTFISKTEYSKPMA